MNVQRLPTATNPQICITPHGGAVLKQEEWEILNRDFTWTLCCCCRTWCDWLHICCLFTVDLTSFMTFSSGRSSRHQISPAKGTPTWGPNLRSREGRSWRTTSRYDDVALDPIFILGIFLQGCTCLLCLADLGTSIFLRLCHCLQGGSSSLKEQPELIHNEWIKVLTQ